MNAPIAPEASRASEAPERPHKPLDVGTFFDRPKPSPRAWITPALLGVGCFAFAAVSMWGDAAFARVMACTFYLSLALRLLIRAWSRRPSR